MRFPNKMKTAVAIMLALCTLLCTMASCGGGSDTETEDTSSATVEDVTSSGSETEEATNDGEDTEGETQKGAEGETQKDAESETQKGAESETQKEAEAETSEAVYELAGTYGDSILYANEMKNGVQAYYPDGDARISYCVENLDMKAEFALTAGNKPMLTYLKSQSGGAFLENTMDVYVRMKDGKTYFASDSDVAPRTNTYRIGYYYYDVRILNQSFGATNEVIEELKMDPRLFKHYNSGSISGYKAQKDLIRYVVSGGDPYFSCGIGEIGIAFDEYDAIQFSVKSSNITQAQVFIITDTYTTFNASRSQIFEVSGDGEWHTYTIRLSEFSVSEGKITAVRFDVGNVIGEMIEVKDIRAVKFSSDAPYILLDRTLHTYSDRLHQELHFVAPEGQDNIDALGMITEIPAQKVSKIIIKDKKGTHTSLGGVDMASLEYVGFDIVGVGIFGYIMPFDGKGGSLSVALNGGNYVITQEACPENGEILSPVSVKSTANDFFMGQRLYTDESHDFAEFIKEAEQERNPLESVRSDGYVRYDSLRGAYLFSIGGTDFNSAFHYNQNQHFETSVVIENPNATRSIYIRTATTSGCLECAVLLDGDGMVLPIALEVSKNFGEGEEPIMNYGDKSYGETVFPLIVEQNATLEFSVLNLYQNWGRFPLKQLSSIAYYAPYYHLSLGITETTCISPWYVRGRTLWTLPDFRAISAPYWFELEGSAFRNEPQHSNAGLFEILHYTDADGNYIAPENYNNAIDSSGPIYAEVRMDYLTDDGKMKISYNHLEMPQTDELRPYYEVNIEILEDISIKDFKNDFVFYAWNTTREKVGYLDANGQHREEAYSASDATTEYVLGKISPYFGNFGTNSSDATNLGLLVHSYDFTVGGKKFDGNFVVVEKAKNRFALTLDLGEVTLKKGDTLDLNIIMIPWGSHLSENANNLAYIRDNSAIDPFKITAVEGEAIDSVYMPRIRTANGKSAVFTLSGGANNVAVRAYGFEKLTSPQVYELIGGEWVKYELSSVDSPDSVGVRHYYDGYYTYYDGDGTYSYAFAVNMDEADQRTFKIVAEKDFEKWPEIEYVNEDPIEYYMDASELSKMFTNSVPGISSAVLNEDEGYLRLTGDGKGVDEVTVSVFSAVSKTPTGQYIVFKYRMPSANKEKNTFEFFASTVNNSAKGSDSIWLSGNHFKADDNWHVVIVDASTFKPDTFKAAADGKYYCNYVRFDVLNTALSTDSCVDIAYFGICDTIEELCELNSDVETMLLLSSGKTETVNVKTGEITLQSGGTPSTPSTPATTDGVTVSKDASSFLSSESRYKLSSVAYFGRIDSLNGIGPNGEIGKSYNNRGSNSAEGVAVFEYNNPTTADLRLVFAGWSLVYGGAKDYVWSADGGKTWQSVELYNRSSIGKASGSADSGMIGYANRTCGKTDFELYADNSSYQGNLEGPDNASGIAADLSAFEGKTVDVLFAVIPVTEPDSVCILAKVKGVKVERDGKVSSDSEVLKTEIKIKKDAGEFIDASNAQGFSASKLHYFARIDTVNGFGPDFQVGKAFDAGSNDLSGIVTVTYGYSSSSDKMCTISGWNLVEGGVERYVWSADGGKTWHDISESRRNIKTASEAMVNYTKTKYSVNVDFSAHLENSSYQGSLDGLETASGISADLSAYAGQTVNVTFAAVPATDPDGLCIIAHVIGVKVVE